jgi:hypothetical protein
MPDRKFEQKADRQRITLDFKQRVIDLMANNQPLPEVGIYDEPVRYFKANEQWCAVIFGWLDWLEDIAGWQAAEDDTYPGIQQILIFEEGITMEPIDYDAMREAVCEAIECGMEKVAARYLSGTAENLAGGDIVIPPGGTPTVIPPGQAPDDTTTSADEEARSGGSNAIRLGLNKLFLDMNAWFTAGVLVADAKTRLLALYDLNQAEAEAFVDFYYTTYAAPANPIVLSSALDGYLYCDGISTESIARYVYDSHTPSTDADTIIKLLPALGGQLMAWYNVGKLIPSADYIVYSCVPIDPEEFLLDGTYLQSSTYKFGIQTSKLNHRILVEVSGKVNHPSDGSYQDFFYQKLADDTITAVGLSTAFGTRQFNHPFGNPPASKIPFETSGIYRFTMETISTEPYEFRRAISAPYYGSGSFTIKFTDLGEILT